MEGVIRARKGAVLSLGRHYLGERAVLKVWTNRGAHNCIVGRQHLHPGGGRGREWKATFQRGAGAPADFMRKGAVPFLPPGSA